MRQLVTDPNGVDPRGTSVTSSLLSQSVRGQEISSFPFICFHFEAQNLLASCADFPKIRWSGRYQWEKFRWEKVVTNKAWIWTSDTVARSCRITYSFSFTLPLGHGKYQSFCSLLILRPKKAPFPQNGPFSALK